MKQRNDSLDIAKGISLIFVMISHGAGFLIPKVGYLAAAYYISIFFIVSGYLYQANDNSYLKKRFKRLIYPYIFYTFILLICYILYQLFFDKFSIIDSFKNFIKSFYSRNVLYYPYETNPNIHFFCLWNGPMWFLTAMFTSSIVYYFVIDKSLSNKKNFVITFVLLLVATILFSKLPILLPWSLDFAPMGALFMISGTFFKKIKIDKIKPYIIFLLIIIYVLLVSKTPGINLSVRSYGGYGIFGILKCYFIGVIGSLLCLYFSTLVSKIKILKNIFSLIGKNTVIILSLHLMIFSIMNQIVGEEICMQLWYGFFQISFTIFICLIIKKIFEFFHVKKSFL